MRRKNLNSAKIRKPTMTLRKKTVLVADDSETFVMYFSLLLKRLGFDVIPAENGLEAVKLIKVTEPNLVMLDIRLPGMDGIIAGIMK